MPSKTQVHTNLVYDKRQFELRSGVTPYVCSTSTDFKDEHKALSTKVFPALKALCHNRASYFNQTYIPWSKFHDAVQHGQLLTLCLRNIERCAPFFICLIGETYGIFKERNTLPLKPKKSTSVREKKTLTNRQVAFESKKVEDEKLDWWDKSLRQCEEAGYHWVLEDMNQYQSLVELQIALAAFREEYEFCRFYYRQPEHKDLLFKDVPDKLRQEKLAIYEPESEFCDLKVRELKHRIVKRGLPVKYFKTVEELCTCVYNDWSSLINTLCPPLFDSLGVHSTAEESVYKEWLAHESFAESRRKTYISLPEYDDIQNDLTEFALTALDDPPEGWNKDEQLSSWSRIKEMNHPDEYAPALYQSIFAIAGDRGSGKTSMISNWVKLFSQECDFLRVFSYYVGSTADSTDTRKMLKSCMAYFSNQLQHNIEYIEAINGEEESLESLSHIFKSAISHQPCVIVIDGLDDLGKIPFSHNSQSRSLLWLLYPLPPNVRLIITTVRSDKSCSILMKRPDTKVVEMPNITSEESKVEMLQQYMGSAFEKLKKGDRELIMESSQTEVALYISVLGNELKQSELYRNQDLTVESYLEASTVRELLVKVLKRWIDNYSWTTMRNTEVPKGFRKSTDIMPDTCGWVADVMRLICVSQYGLSEMEILKLLVSLGYVDNSAVSKFDWRLFFTTVYDSFLYESADGLLNFRHYHIKETVQHRLLVPEGPKRKMFNTKSLIPKKQHDPKHCNLMVPIMKYHTALSNFFLASANLPRKTQELPWQLLSCREWTKLKQVLGEPKLFASLYGDKDHRGDLRYFWACLGRIGHDVDETYMNMLAEMTHINEVPEIKLTDNVSVDGTDSETKDTKQRKAKESDRLTFYVGKFLADLRHYEKSLMILMPLQTSLKQHNTINESTEKLLCEVRYAIASNFLQLGMLEESINVFQSSLGCLENLKSSMLTHSEQNRLKEIEGKVFINLTDVYTKQHRTNDAIHALDHARMCMVHCSALIGVSHVLLMSGKLKLEKNHYVSAENYYIDALAAFEKWYGHNHYKVADVLQEYAGLICNQQNPHRYDVKASERMYRRALRLREMHYGGSHLLVAQTLSHFGQLLQTFDDSALRKEAIEMLRKSHDLHIIQLGTKHPASKAVHKVLSEIEAALQFKSHYVRNFRSGDQRHSLLSWRESELSTIQQRQERQNAKKQNKKLGVVLKAMTAIRSISKPKILVDDDDEKNLQVSIISETEEEVGSPSAEQQTQNITERTEKAADTERTETAEVSERTGITEITVRKEIVEDIEQSAEVGQAPSTPAPIESTIRSQQIQPVTWVEIKPVEKCKDQYLDNFSDQLPEQSPSPTAQILRPQSAPFNTFTKYKQKANQINVLRTAPESPRSVAKQHKKREVVSAPTAIKVPKKSEKKEQTSHMQNCKPPGRFALHQSNMLSVSHGPYTTTESLLEPQVPRDITKRQFHQSAWYHVPGRYSTIETPYPPKRSQKRVECAQKKLVKNLRTRSGLKMLTTKLPLHVNTERKPNHISHI